MTSPSSLNLSSHNRCSSSLTISVGFHGTLSSTSLSPLNWGGCAMYQWQDLYKYHRCSTQTLDTQTCKTFSRSRSEVQSRVLGVGWSTVPSQILTSLMPPRQILSSSPGFPLSTNWSNLLFGVVLKFFLNKLAASAVSLFWQPHFYLSSMNIFAAYSGGCSASIKT